MLDSIIAAAELSDDDALHSRLAVTITQQHVYHMKKIRRRDLNVLDRFLHSYETESMYRKLLHSIMIWQKTDLYDRYDRAIKLFLRSLYKGQESVPFEVVLSRNVVIFSSIKHNYSCESACTRAIQMHLFAHFLLGIYSQSWAEFRAATRCHSRKGKLPKAAFRRKLELDFPNSAQWDQSIWFLLAGCTRTFYP